MFRLISRTAVTRGFGDGDAVRLLIKGHTVAEAPMSGDKDQYRHRQ
ncbi:hypothetical protein AB0F72_14200 [Actinoplanes sp. NPDC023936]